MFDGLEWAEERRDWNDCYVRDYSLFSYDVEEEIEDDDDDDNY